MVTTVRTMLGDVGREVQTDEEGDISYMQTTNMMDLKFAKLFFTFIS